MDEEDAREVLEYLRGSRKAASLRASVGPTGSRGLVKKKREKHKEKDAAYVKGADVKGAAAPEKKAVRKRAPPAIETQAVTPAAHPVPHNLKHRRQANVNKRASIEHDVVTPAAVEKRHKRRKNVEPEDLIVNTLIQ